MGILHPEIRYHFWRENFWDHGLEIHYVMFLLMWKRCWLFKWHLTYISGLQVHRLNCCNSYLFCSALEQWKTWSAVKLNYISGYHVGINSLVTISELGIVQDNKLGRLPQAVVFLLLWVELHNTHNRCHFPRKNCWDYCLEICFFQHGTGADRSMYTWLSR